MCQTMGLLSHQIWLLCKLYDMLDYQAIQNTLLECFLDIKLSILDAHFPIMLVFSRFFPSIKTCVAFGSKWGVNC